MRLDFAERRWLKKSAEIHRPSQHLKIPRRRHSRRYDGNSSSFSSLFLFKKIIIIHCLSVRGSALALREGREPATFGCISDLVLT